MIKMEAIPKFDIKSVIKSDIKFDISTKLTTWIGQVNQSIKKHKIPTWSNVHNLPTTVQTTNCLPRKKILRTQSCAASAVLNIQ